MVNIFVLIGKTCYIRKTCYIICHARKMIKMYPHSTIFQFYRGGQFYWLAESGIPEENHRPVASHWQILSHNVVSNTPCHEKGSSHSLVYLFPPTIYSILVEQDNCYITHTVYLFPPTIYSILVEQDNCYITQTVYLFPPTIYSIVVGQYICYITQKVYLGVELNKLLVWCNSYTALLECCRS
jgi:hypothetical protein